MCQKASWRNSILTTEESIKRAALCPILESTLFSTDDNKVGRVQKAIIRSLRSVFCSKRLKNLFSSSTSRLWQSDFFAVCIHTIARQNSEDWDVKADAFESEIRLNESSSLR